MHAQDDPGRARRWGCAPYMAQLLANAVAYYRDTPEGQRVFKKWLQEEYKDKASTILRLQNLKPAERTKVKPQNMITYKASMELGVHVQLLRQYQMCAVLTKDSNVRPPKTNIPSPWRKLNEPGYMWYARRHAARENGCEKQPFLFSEALAMALSETDRLKDMMTLWRTTPTLWVEAVEERQKSLLLMNKEIAECRSDDEIHHTRADNAARNYLFVTMVAFNTWQYTGEVFEDLVRRGLTTSDAIEAACLSDHSLLWRMLTVFTRMQNSRLQLWGRLIQSLPAAPRFAPFVSRFRDAQGFANLYRDERYIAEHGFGDSKLLEPIIDCIVDDGAGMDKFLPRLATYLAQNPSDSSLFDQQTMNFLGEYSVADEFMEVVSHTQLGRKLSKLAQSLESLPQEKHAFQMALTPFDMTGLLRWLPNVKELARHSYGLSTKLTETFVDMIRHQIMTINLRALGAFTGPGWLDPASNGPFFDKLWDEIDYFLFLLVGFGRHGAHSRVVTELNLITHDPNQPRSQWIRACDFFFNELDPSRDEPLLPKTMYGYKRPDPFAGHRPPVAEPTSDMTALLSAVKEDTVVDSDKVTTTTASPEPSPEPSADPVPASSEATSLESSSHVGSKWDVLGNLSPEVMLPSDPYQQSFSWENLVMDKAQIKWSEEPEPEWLTEAIAAHPDYDEYLAQPILTPATSRPESPARDDEPEEPESPATGKGKKKKKGKGPPPAPTPKKVKVVQPPPPPKLRRRQTPPPEVPDYPQSLPSTFHVPKKVYKVLQVFASRAKSEEDPKKPQIRWADFERAMRRIGFVTVSSMGSLVRFEPPAQTARPISFFRPHPATDPIPDLHLRVMGARLQKCYGWNDRTFVLAVGMEEEKVE